MLEWIGGIPVGRWLFLGIILVPIYGLLFAWFVGKPRNVKLALRGVAYLLMMIAVLWGGLFALSMVIRFVFYPV